MKTYRGREVQLQPFLTRSL